MLFAQAAESLVGSNSTLLVIVLLSTLVTVGVSVYRFIVNMRTTERGMAKNRIREANRNEQLAQRESYLWQQRCADLEYILRRNGVPIPPFEEDLRKLIGAAALNDDTTSPPQVDWNITPEKGGSAGE